MSRKYFGTDGIRGTANTEPMTVEIAQRLGQAAGLRFRRGAHRHRVVARLRKHGLLALDKVFRSRIILEAHRRPGIGSADGHSGTGNCRALPPPRR